MEEHELNPQGVLAGAAGQVKHFRKTEGRWPYDPPPWPIKTDPANTPVLLPTERYRWELALLLHSPEEATAIRWASGQPDIWHDAFVGFFASRENAEAELARLTLVVGQPWAWYIKSRAPVDGR